MDIDGIKIDGLSQGQVPFYEPGLTELVSDQIKTSRLRFTSNASEAVDFAAIQIVAVGTATDSQHVYDVVQDIAQRAKAPKVLVIKSTVPVGTCEDLKKKLLPPNFEICVNPEFLRQGEAISDFTQGPRVVLGVESEAGRKAITELYAVFPELSQRMIFMDLRAAEMTKYAANAFLATKISFMNEMAQIAEKLHVDIDLVRRGVGTDPRIGSQFINPGAGFGGSCFPKDLQSLIQTAVKDHVEVPLLKAVVAVNDRQRASLFKKLSQSLSEPLHGKVIAVWGLSFKPNTDDMREAPSRILLEALWDAGAIVRAYDPQAMEVCRRLYGDRKDLVLVSSKEAALDGAEALVICTEWSEFAPANLDFVAGQLKSKVVIDGRNIFDPQKARSAGLIYHGVGRN